MTVTINPEELAAVLVSRDYPVESVERISRPPLPPRYGLGHENLYGLPVFVVGEGFRGQFLRHRMYYRGPERWWIIELGWVALYGRLRGTEILVPLVVMGLPTPYVLTYSARSFDGFILDELPKGEFIEVRESDIINLDRAMEGRDPILIIDRYGLLRADRGAPDLYDRCVELQRMVEEQQRLIHEYERMMLDYQTNVRILTSENTKLKELVQDYGRRLQRLATEVLTLQQELARLREEVNARLVELSSVEDARAVLVNLADRLTSMLRDAAALVDLTTHDIHRRIEELARTAAQRRGGEAAESGGGRK